MDIPESKNILSTDVISSDLEIVQHNDESALLGEYSKRQIYSIPKDLTVSGLSKMIKDKQLILQPDYQREYIFSVKKASLLIESILLRVPIPAIFLAEESTNRWSVIDGQQRLTSLHLFLMGVFSNDRPFRLSGLKELPKLNGMLYSELPDSLQMRINSTTLHCILIEKESNPQVKFEIFGRLNNGGAKLNDDEIRNALYPGAYKELLKELSNNKTFEKIVNKPELQKRMLYRGMILRFLTFCNSDIVHYKTNMSAFMNDELRENKNMGQENVKIYREKFIRSISLIKTVFGENIAFRKPFFCEKTKQLKYESRVNQSLFEIQMHAFVKFDKSDILRNADLIRERVLDLFLNDNIFMGYVSSQTGSIAQVRGRFDKYMEVMRDAIENTETKKRFFSFEVRKQLFDANPVCAISGQRILSIEDAEVDHIIPYSKGGTTTIDNAQLVHRYFNRVKGNKLELDL